MCHLVVACYLTWAVRGLVFQQIPDAWRSMYCKCKAQAIDHQFMAVSVRCSKAVYHCRYACPHAKPDIQHRWVAANLCELVGEKLTQMLFMRGYAYEVHSCARVLCACGHARGNHMHALFHGIVRADPFPVELRHTIVESVGGSMRVKHNYTVVNSKFVYEEVRVPSSTLCTVSCEQPAGMCLTGLCQTAWHGCPRSARCARHNVHNR